MEKPLLERLDEAAATIGEALKGTDPPAKAKALVIFFGWFDVFLAFGPLQIEKAILAALKVTADGSQNFLAELIVQLPENVMGRFHILLRMLHPRWMNGAEEMFDHAPPFEEVRESLMAALDCGVIDYEGMVAILIGRYGPDAESVLPDLIKRLRENRTDCSKAPGLTWAVYQIGGVRPDVRDLLIEIATKADSCPHSQPIAQEILRMNQITY